MKALDLLEVEVNSEYDMVLVEKAMEPIDIVNKTHADNIKLALLKAYTLVKPALRGGVVGAGFLASTNFLTNQDPATGAALGSLIGAGLDYLSSAIRFDRFCFRKYLKS